MGKMLEILFNRLEKAVNVKHTSKEKHKQESERKS